MGGDLLFRSTKVALVISPSTNCLLAYPVMRNVSLSHYFLSPGSCIAISLPYQSDQEYMADGVPDEEYGLVDTRSLSR